MKETLLQDRLKIEVEERAPNRIVAWWTGRSDARDPGKHLDPFLSQLIAEAQAGNRVLELKFEYLEYFNSSTVGALLRLINSATENQVHVELSYDPALRWQSISFEALERAAAASSGNAPFVHIRAIERPLKDNSQK